jgi:hypothetical protein
MGLREQLAKAGVTEFIKPIADDPATKSPRATKPSVTKTEPVTKKRGRPAKGDRAMTPAEKQRAYRQRKAKGA